MPPQGFCTRMSVLLGPTEYDAFAASWERPRPTSLRLNPLKPSPPAIHSHFQLTPVPWTPDGYYCSQAIRPGQSPLHDAGAYYLQEASAMAPAVLLDVHPGMRVLDLCAAPGGKSAQLAAALNGHGLLLSNEIDPKRAAILSRNMERMAVSNALILNEHPAALAARFPSSFDRILVDAPCSGEGMFRKEEAAVTGWSEDQIAACARRQREILESAAHMLRPGGRLVYSTCTFAPEENEGVVSSFLHAHPDFTVAAADAPWFSPGRPDWITNPAPGLERTFRLWPHKLTGEGHYAAILERTGSQPPQSWSPEHPIPEPPELRDFRAALSLPIPEGHLISFGRTVWQAPEDLPSLRGLRVLRPGLELGEVRKGRLEPSHAWALWLRDCPASVSFPAGSPEIAAYLSGAPIPGESRGWTLVQVDGLTLGWCKGSAGILKNHYPKGLRREISRIEQTTSIDRPSGQEETIWQTKC